MQASSHRIEVYEPFEYDGPNPINLKAEGLLVTPDKKDAFLLGVDTVLSIDGEEYRQIVVRPRFLDPIERATQSSCTVIISLVRPDHSIDVDSQYQYTDVLNWGIGKINPYNPG